MSNEKTNVMRILDQKKIAYEYEIYEDTDAVSGREVAEVLNQDPNRVFKTLVTVGKSNEHFVFLVPVSKELNLKKAAKAVNEKKIEMLPSKELLALTGYIHGGCSPLGMKKQFKIVIDSSAENFESIIFNGGKRGYQIIVKLKDLKKILRYRLEDII